jgi:hypothetical protein
VKLKTTYKGVKMTKQEELNKIKSSLIKELARLVVTGKLSSVEDALNVIKNVFGVNDDIAQFLYGKYGQSR